MQKHLKLHTDGPSYCCNAPQLLVQSREGGFISKNCTDCGQPRPVGIRELPDHVCEECGAVMRPATIAKNYWYACSDCEQRLPLWASLPFWSDHFAYCGLAVPEASRNYNPSSAE